MRKYPPIRTFPQEFTLVVPEDALRFDSKFESGNLKKAVRVRDREYNLHLEYDVETKGYTQWFYFSVENAREGQSVRFNIVNFMKYESLYNAGMKPLVYSEKQKEKGWHRECSAVSYFKNQTPRIARGRAQYFYTLTFTYVFKCKEDKVFFAYCFPYTYSQLMSYLNTLRSDDFSSFVRIDTLCSTLAGLPSPVLTITNNVSTFDSWENELIKLSKSAAGRKWQRMKDSKSPASNKKALEHQGKKCVFLTARAHPGESNGSYMMKGAIDFLVGDSREAKLLRKKFVFKIIPMINPDGVVYGNYRCSLLGVDLNRRWKRPNKLLHPEIYYAKRLIQMVAEEREVALYCDMHGHSIKKDIFMYGCRNVENKKQDAFIRIIPYLLSKRSALFSYKSCVFRVNKNKQATGRVVCFSDIGVVASYTMEASFYGPSHSAKLENREPRAEEPNGDSHMSTFHLESIGKDFCLQLLTLVNSRIFHSRLKEITVAMEKGENEERNSEETQEIVDIEEIEGAQNSSLSSFLNDIDENALNALYFSGSDESDYSDSEGSDNDDKKYEFKLQKITKPIKSPTKPEIISNSIDPVQPKKLRKTIANMKSIIESPKSEASISPIKRSNRYNSIHREPIYYLNKSPENERRPAAIVKALQTSENFRKSVKYAASAKLPGENIAVRGGLHSQMKSWQEKRFKVEKFRDKSEMIRTKVRFTEVLISMKDIQFR
jgi:cytosolic carboxypeptidase protein 2/3